MLIEELWSDAHEARVEVCVRAALRGDLTEALFAIEGAPADAVAADEALLEVWGQRVAARLAGGAASAEEQAQALAAVLGGELGFRGDTHDYYQARNSHLHEVITHRRGLPILLSVVWMEVGAAAGIHVEGVGLPGHFIVRVGHEALADPFGGGRPLEVEDCKRIVHEMSQGKVVWHDELLATSTVAQIVERVLQNLVNSGSVVSPGSSGAEHVFRTLGFLVKLRPDAPAYLLNRAIAAERVGARKHAHDTFAEVIRRFPGSREARIAAERHRMGGASRPLN